MKVRRSVVPTAFILLMALLPGPARAQPGTGELGGRLERGANAVGFRTLHVRDVSRPALAAEVAGTPVPPQGRGRQMQISLWYPARAGGRGSLRFAHYVHALAQELDFSPLDEARRRRAVAKFLEQPAGLGGDTAALRRAMPALLALPTTASADARPAPGRHPLVLFPEWRAPATNSVLAEYLASHGYVVASPTLKGTYEAQPDISAMGLETQAADLRFVLVALDSLPFVDAERLALVGVGIAASGALALQMRTPAVDAFVSLEGGITTEGELAMIRRSPYYDVAAVRAPILAITAPHPDVDPARLDVYRYATRHLVHFPRMGEFWFLNYGMLERHAPGIIGKPPGDTRLGFEWGARYTLRFLDAYVRGDSTAHRWLLAAPTSNEVPDGVLATETRQGLAAPPALAELRAILLQSGVAGLRALYEVRRGRDPQPIPAERFVALHAWLGDGRDSDWVARRELAELRVAMYPESSRAHYTLGMIANRTGDAAAARAHLTEALRGLPGDPDPQLDPATRARLERLAREALQRLGS